MRLTDRRGRQRSRDLPEEHKKIDTSVNGNAEELIRAHKELEKDLYPLIINARTTIYVPKHKHNEEYRQKWIKRHGYDTSALSGLKELCAKKKKNVNADVTKKDISNEDIERLVNKEGMSARDAARELGCSEGLIYGRIKKYHLK